MKSKSIHIHKKIILTLLFIAFGLCHAQGLMEVKGQDATNWTDSTTQGSLGVTRVDVEETPMLTTITGWDSNGREVGKVEILHGSFELSGIFIDNSDEPGVTGRRLEVNVLGQNLHWETEGFAPTLGLPAHPASQWALAAFLEDSRVKPLLKRWGIGFQSNSNKKPDAPFVCDLEGTNPFECSGEKTCDTLFVRMNKDITFPPSTCGGDIEATEAWTVYQSKNASYQLDQSLPFPPEQSYNQSVVAQCCPGSTPGFGRYLKKTCTERTDCSVENPCVTTCGTITSLPSGTISCRGCPNYSHDNTNDKCTMRIEHAGWKDLTSPKSKNVYMVCARYAWFCGDGYCDGDEDCATCIADCACHGDNSCVAPIAAGEKSRCCENGLCEGD